MLQIKPDTGDAIDAEEKTDDALYCAGCGHLVTRTRWAIKMGGRERVFTNPTGYTFRIVCFSDAPGATAEGERTGDHTWFQDYLWNFALCQGCGGHLGWHFRQVVGGDRFFGLVKNRLSSSPA